MDRFSLNDLRSKAVGAEIEGVPNQSPLHQTRQLLAIQGQFQVPAHKQVSHDGPIAYISALRNRNDGNTMGTTLAQLPEQGSRIFSDSCFAEIDEDRFGSLLIDNRLCVLKRRDDRHLSAMISFEYRPEVFGQCRVVTDNKCTTIG